MQNKKIYILETTNNGKHSYTNKDLFFRDWTEQLNKRSPCSAYELDYSNIDELSFKEYESELKMLLGFKTAKSISNEVENYINILNDNHLNKSNKSNKE